MQRKGHIIAFLITLFFVILISQFTSSIIRIVYTINFALLSIFFAIYFTPDSDKNEEIKIIGHRNMITHSLLMPVAMYWIIHPYLNMETAKEFAGVLFLPFLVHLMADLGGVKGFGLIRMFKLTFSIRNSYLWLVINIVVMLVYLVIWL